MVATVAGDGAPRLLSVVRTSGVCWTRLFRSLTVPLVGLRPFSLPLFHPALRSIAWFCGSSLSLAVLAGLQPQVTTFDHCFTIVYFYSTSTSLHNYMLMANSHQVYPAEHTRRRYSTFGVIQNMQHLPTYGTNGAFPFGRLTCVLRRRCQLHPLI